jgi:hypothetical protein
MWLESLQKWTADVSRQLLFNYCTTVLVIIDRENFHNHNMPGLQIFKTITTAVWIITVGNRLFAKQKH